MQFMLNITVDIPDNLSQREKNQLRARETARAIELTKSGNLRHIWRCAATTSNYSVWEAETPEKLHEIIQTLPMFPFMSIAVTPIIKHPVTEALEAS